MSGSIVAPLLTRDIEEDIACVHSPLCGMDAELEYPRCISVSEFLVHVDRVAEQLPAASHVLNLCDNRYLFLVVFCAVIARAKTNLLPPNRHLATQATLLQRYGNLAIVHDGIAVIDDNNVASVNIAHCNFASPLNFPAALPTIPSIALAHIAAVTFTSGSTGHSQAHHKSWLTFVRSTEINRRYMLPQVPTVMHLVATVPGQHMWGLETSILMTLMAPICMSDIRPFFPADVASSLALLPPPRALVSTPVHLRALCLSGLKFPPLHRVLCATAPLSQALAEDVETLVSGELIEVYGCSEVGSMACRHTAASGIWHAFDGLLFNASVEQGPVQVEAEHLPEVVTLQDCLQFDGPRRFQLLGREGDMIEMGGKRGSLAELNKLLLAVDGVIDGVVFLPDDERTIVRLAAFVVGDARVDKPALVRAFRRAVDPVFVPRPFVFVAELPREENGKLPRAKLLQLFKERLSAR